MDIPPLNSSVNTTPERRLPTEEMEKIAVTFEANFLAEMLKFGGHGESRESFGGGVGEDAFAGMLVREQATLMAQSGGIGLAEHIVESLIRSEK